MELHYVLKLVNFDYAFNTIINPQDQVNPPLQVGLETSAGSLFYINYYNYD